MMMVKYKHLELKFNMAITSIKTGSSFTNLKKYDSFLAGNPAFGANSYESIATYTIGSDTASVTFSSIPSTYANLQIRFTARKNGTQNDSVGMGMQFNGDDTSSYNSHYLQGDGTSATGYSSGASMTTIGNIYFAGGGMTANTFGPGVIDILDYANTNKYKATRQLSGISSNATVADRDYLLYGSGLWRSTSAITSITLTGNSFAQYSHFALYGIKGV